MNRRSAKAFSPLPHLINDLGCREQDKSVAKINQQDAAGEAPLAFAHCVKAECVCEVPFFSLSEMRE